MAAGASRNHHLSTRKTPTRKTAAKKATTRRAVPGSRTRTSTARKKPEAQPVDSTAVWRHAVTAAEDKKAINVKVLDLRGVTSFADYLIVCSGTNPRQIQAITDAVELRLKEHGERPKSVEGYSNAEWILMDYGDYVVNVFSEQARSYYDLERLWRDAPFIPASGSSGGEEPESVTTRPASSEDVR